MLSTLFPDDLRASIASVMVCVNNGVPDILTWQSSLNGVYSVGDDYEWLRRDALGFFSGESWTWIWKLRVPEKVRLFVWQCCHCKIKF